jgi:drug/metabolite transporter (DMT)-like permease
LSFTKSIYNPSPNTAVGFFILIAVGGITMKTEPANSNLQAEPGSVRSSTRDAHLAHKAPAWLVVAAFATVYLVWGSTYLGIRYAVDSIPPFMMAGARHLVAGVVLFAFVYWRGVAMPKWIEWRDAAIAGILMLVIGNGGVTWAEQRIPSGVTALLVALVPLWMVLLDWFRPGGTRPRVWVSVGLLMGIAGVTLLARGHGEHHESAYGWSVAALMIASICWAWGSLFSRSARKPKSPLLAVAMQMIAGGTVLLLLAAAQGEFGRFAFNHVTRVSFGSWLYLTIAGSLIAYTAYVWILQVSTPARVATYAYVNPLIAVILGCTFGHEMFSRELIVAGALIVLAVVLIVRGGAQSAVRKIPQPAIQPAAAVPE